jgi:hypothetical protein
VNFLRKIYNNGFLWTLNALISKMSGRKYDFRPEIVTYKHRIKISNNVAQHLGYVVRYGVFKGLKLSNNVFWGEGDLGSKALGLYEQEIQTLLFELQDSKKRKTLIDIGGADGYFAIGALVSKLFTKVIVFEISSKGRETLRDNAVINCIENNLTILKEASSESFQNLVDSNLNLADSVVLCDIEGAEYDLFNDEILKKLLNSHIIIEIHCWDESMKKKKEEFHERVLKLFDIRKIRTQGRDFSPLTETHDLSDQDRSLLVSEGRLRLGEWWHLTPKN